jgi:hypothetical protein
MSEKASGTVRAHHGSVEWIALLGLVSSLVVQEFFIQFFLSMSELTLLSIGAITCVFKLSAELSLVFSIINSSLLLGLKGGVEDVFIARVNGNLGFPDIRGFNVGTWAVVSGGSGSTGFSRSFTEVLGTEKGVPLGVGGSDFDRFKRGETERSIYKSFSRAHFEERLCFWK